MLGLDEEKIAHLFETKVVSDVPTNPGLSGRMDTETMLKLRTLVAVDPDYKTVMKK